VAVVVITIEYRQGGRKTKKTPF